MGFLSRRGYIADLAHKSGNWTVTEQEGDRHWVATVGRSNSTGLRVLYNARFSNVLFQCHFPVQFSLERPPANLSTRLLMRSFEMRYGAWCMTITDNAQAGLSVCARIPKVGLDAQLFGEVCSDLTTEVGDFMRELREKFQYDLGDPVRGPGRSGVPMRADSGGIQFLG